MGEVVDPVERHIIVAADEDDGAGSDATRKTIQLGTFRGAAKLLEHRGGVCRIAGVDDVADGYQVERGENGKPSHVRLQSKSGASDARL